MKSVEPGIKTIIMAGGSGTRLWPCSRKNLPKQFLDLVEEKSFIQSTAERLAGIDGKESVYVVSGNDYRFHIEEHLSPLFNENFDRLILEPSGRNTAPAIALSVKYFMDVEKADPAALLLFAPADHIIHPASALQEAVLAAKKAAADNIVTFGIVPDYPDTGYGYIEKGDEEAGLHKVKRFTEKPEANIAKEYVDSGNYLWNGGMFLFSIDAICKALQKHAPDLWKVMEKYSYDELIAHYDELPAISIDYAVMEKAENILCQKLDLSWNDVGSWDAVYDVLPKDENGNALVGDAVAMGAKNSLVISKQRLTALLHLENIVLVETEDAVLVCDRSHSQEVGPLVRELKKQKRKEAVEHATTYRPWGRYTVLEEGERFKIKRIVVNPGAQLSLQRHKHRSEHWVVTSGMATVTIGDEIKHLHENESVYVPKYENHRLENKGRIPLEIIEVQNGEYVGEDDIERLEDTYGRA